MGAALATTKFAAMPALPCPALHGSDQVRSGQVRSGQVKDLLTAHSAANKQCTTLCAEGMTIKPSALTDPTRRELPHTAGRDAIYFKIFINTTYFKIEAHVM